MTTKKGIEEKSELKPPIRMAAEDRRLQILEVAMELFSQRGFRGTTTKEIALAAGVNEAIIYRHFATKNELYAAIVDHKAKAPRVQQLQMTLHEAMKSGDDRRVFESLAFSVLEFHEQDEMAMRILLYSALEGHELAEMIYRNHLARIHRQLTDYVEKRIADGSFRRVDAKTVVRGFMGMIINQVMFKKFFQRYDNEPPALTNRQAAEQFTDLFLTSLTALPRQSKSKK